MVEEAVVPVGEIYKRGWYSQKKYGYEGNYVVGANIAGFEKVVDAMTAQGIC